jgi:hypothetical protein
MTKPTSTEARWLTFGTRGIRAASLLADVGHEIPSALLLAPVVLAAVQSFGNLGASAIAGVLWTLAPPQAAFAYLVAWTILALPGLYAAGRRPF